jgi:hypothetical protein
VHEAFLEAAVENMNSGGGFVSVPATRRFQDFHDRRTADIEM